MEFIQHTINWAKGEIQEAVIVGIVGLIIIISALLFWKFGNTPNAKAMVWPLLIVGLIPFIMSFSGVYINKSRIIEYSKQYEANPKAFVQAEKERVKGFDEIFKYSYPAAIIMIIGGAILFFVIKTPYWKAISLALMVMGLMAYFIDHFAAERADIYYKQIEKSLKNNINMNQNRPSQPYKLPSRSKSHPTNQNLSKSMAAQSHREKEENKALKHNILYK